ncbi:MAG: dockerin type I domain-containing protein, partial [Planctomycetota bacterium]
IVDEFGGLGTESPLGNADPQLLGTVQFTADAEGVLTLASDAPDLLPTHEFGLYGYDNPVALGDIQFAATQLTITAAQHEGPVAEDDSYNVFHDNGTIDLDVLDNDTVADGLQAELVSVTPSDPAAGTFAISEGIIQFSPAEGVYGNVTAQYVMSDGSGADNHSDSAEITVNVAKRWHLSASPTDVNNDGGVSPLDALRIINALSRQDGAFPADPNPQGDLALEQHYLDVNNDGNVSAIDALLTIQHLAEQADNRSGESLLSAGDRLDAQLLDQLAVPRVF